MKTRLLITILLLSSLLIACGGKNFGKITEETLKKITVENAHKKADLLLSELDSDF